MWPSDWLDNPLRWLAANLIAERERWPLWLPVLFGAGIGVYFWLTVEPLLWLGLLAAAVTLPVAIVALRTRRSAAPAVAMAAVALGFAAAEIEAWWVGAPVLQRQLHFVAVEGRLVRIEPLPEATRLVIASSSIERVGDAHLPTLIRVNLHKTATDLLPGEWLRVKAELYPSSGPAMPGAYDFQRQAFFERLAAVGYARSAPQRIEPPAGAALGSWRIAVEGARSAVAARIHAALPGEEGAIAAALITG